MLPDLNAIVLFDVAAVLMDASVPNFNEFVLMVTSAEAVIPVFTIARTVVPSAVTDTPPLA